ncbi:hypothetical protein ACSSVZ_005669, partial [Amorphus sp. MBR-141]
QIEPGHIISSPTTEERLANIDCKSVYEYVT